jgi:ribonuclease HI
MKPIELPDGQLVCAPHYLTVCGKCCVDYSFLNEINDDADEEDSDEEIDSDEGETDEEIDSDEEESSEYHVMSDEERNEMKAFRERHGIPNGVLLSPLSFLACHRTYEIY